MSKLEDMQKLALEHVSEGRLEEGSSLLRECCTLTGDLYGESSYDFAQSQFTLALCLFRQVGGSNDEIYALAKNALNIRLEKRGKTDVSVAVCAEFFGSICELMAKLDEAMYAYRIALDNALSLVGPKHINTAKAQLNLARITENSTEAKTLTLNAIQTRLEVFGPDSPESIAACEFGKAIGLDVSQAKEGDNRLAPDQNTMR